MASKNFYYYIMFRGKQVGVWSYTREQFHSCLYDWRENAVKRGVNPWVKENCASLYEFMSLVTWTPERILEKVDFLIEDEKRPRGMVANPMCGPDLKEQYHDKDYMDFMAAFKTYVEAL